MLGIIASIVDGVLIGSVYGLAAMGLTLIWGVMNVVNLTHGAAIVFPALDVNRAGAVLRRRGASCRFQKIGEEFCHVALHSWCGRADSAAEV